MLHKSLHLSNVAFESRTGQRLLNLIVRSPQQRRWLLCQRWKLKIALGYRLVPEEDLSQKYREAVFWLRDQGHPLGDYLEFGVFNGTSLSCMHRVVQELNVPDMRLFGFDSFEGLPESATEDNWNPGDYHMDYGYTRRWLTRRGIDWSRVFLIKGWFSETLTSDLVEKYQMRGASVVMIDCDAYQSAKEALAFCAPLLTEEAVIFFDDWASGNRAAQDIGEKKAWDEFLVEHPGFVAEEAGSYNENSMVWRIRRIAVTTQSPPARVAG